MTKKITLHDMTLRDGMHPKRHLMTLDQMKSIACGLDAAGVPLIEVTHGDGLGGSSVNYGFPAHSDEEYLGTVIPLMKQAKVSALLLPGIGTVDHLKMAHGLGVHTIRVATHCTEADVSEQHITYARKLDMDTVGFLMMAHMNSPEGLVKQAKLMEGYGANCIYVTDSAGYMLPDDVKARLPGGDYRFSEQQARQHYEDHEDDESNEHLGYDHSGSGSGTPVAQPANTTGRLLASNCFQCHGTLGRGGFDNIRGGEAGEVREYLGKTASGDIMAAHAQGYTPAQLDAIVKYLNQP